MSPASKSLRSILRWISEAPRASWTGPRDPHASYTCSRALPTSAPKPRDHFLEDKLTTRGKPSTWIPRGGLVEQTQIIQNTKNRKTLNTKNIEKPCKNGPELSGTVCFPILFGPQEREMLIFPKRNAHFSKGNASGTSRANLRNHHLYLFSLRQDPIETSSVWGINVHVCHCGRGERKPRPRARTCIVLVTSPQRTVKSKVICSHPPPRRRS